MIKVHNLAKTFGTKRAVDGVSFSVDRGEVLGFLGPNGAGKSTTMRMITGFIPPTDGTDPNQKHEVRSLIRRMGEKKAIISSTHILEEVDAVCSRAIIIDRGKIVANGTPRELREKSEWAGAVTLRVNGVPAGAVKDKLSQLRTAKRTTILEDRGTRVA